MTNFRNTLAALRASNDVLTDEIVSYDDIADAAERKAARELVKLCAEIAEEWEGAR